jgi:hypothetical protein
VWALRDSDAARRAARSGSPLTTSDGTPVDAPETADPTPAELGSDQGATLVEVAPRTTSRVADAPLLPPMRGDPLALAADVYLEVDDGTLLPGVNGHVRLSLFVGGGLEELVVPVQAGRFACTVPDRSLITVVDGELNGEEVRFADPAGGFEPRKSRMALIGRARPSYTLHVVAAGTGADLTDITLRAVDGPGGAHLVKSPGSAAGTAERSAPEPLATGATSPLRVPWVETRQPLWLEVSAPGYAPARALVDPRASGERTFELHPAAGTLTVHVIGPGRGRMEALVVQRLEAADKRPVAAHFTTAAPGPEAPELLAFEVDGLAAARHLVRVTFLDRAYAGGAVRDLAQGEVDLLVGASARLVLFVPGP